MNKLWNNHMHTSFSGDSDARMQDMILTSIDEGLAGITLTDHLDIDYYHTPGYFDLDIEGYGKCYDSLVDNGIYDKSDANTSIEVLWGIELGLQPHLASKHREIISSYLFIMPCVLLSARCAPLQLRLPAYSFLLTPHSCRISF